MQGRLLTGRERRRVEAVDEAVEHGVPVDLRLQMHEDGSETDGGAVHEDELARRAHPAQFAQFRMHFVRHGRAVEAAFAFLDFLHLVLQQRRIDEFRPDIEDIHQFVRDIRETPCLVGVRGAVSVAVAERVIQVDDAADEGGIEHPHATEIHEVHAMIRADAVIAEMRIPVNDGVFVERHVPGAEHVARHCVAGLDRRVREAHQGRAVEPVHRQEPPGGKTRHPLRHMDAVFAGKHRAVERHVAAFEIVVQFLAQTG